MVRIAIVYYSLHHHISTLAEAIKAAVDAVPGAQAELFQVAETLPSVVLDKMSALPKFDHPVATPQTLSDADGILFGIPTRFGSMPSQLKVLMDACGQLWVKRSLIDKPCGVFASTSSLGGGMETTALSMMPFFAHQGMVFVPLGFRSPLLDNVTEVHGGSLWGAGTVAGHDERVPSELELEIARIQGRSFAEFTLRVAGEPKPATETP